MLADVPHWPVSFPTNSFKTDVFQDDGLTCHTLCTLYEQSTQDENSKLT